MAACRHHRRTCYLVIVDRGLMSRRLSLHALLYCIICEVSASPFSSRHSLVMSLILMWLDYGNTNLTSILLFLLKRLQSVMNFAAWMVFSSSWYDHVTPRLYQLHWLQTRERSDFKLAVLAYKCQHGAAPSHLADELSQLADFEARRCVHSASFLSLTVRCMPLSTIGDQAF